MTKSETNQGEETKNAVRKQADASQEVSDGQWRRPAPVIPLFKGWMRLHFLNHAVGEKKAPAHKSKKTKYSGARSIGPQEMKGKKKS